MRGISTTDMSRNFLFPVCLHAADQITADFFHEAVSVSNQGCRELIEEGIAFVGKVAFITDFSERLTDRFPVDLLEEGQVVVVDNAVNIVYMECL